MVKKMKKKGNTSVPYGSGYKKVNEQTGVKKVIAIYPGRFQPFGPHHKKVFRRIVKTIRQSLYHNIKQYNKCQDTH